MQEVLDFSARESLTSKAFLTFVERRYFNFFLSFAKTQNTFIVLQFQDANYTKIKDVLHSYIKNGDDIVALNQDIFVDIPSFITGKIDDEMRFLNLQKTILSKDATFMGLMPYSFKLNFVLEDLKSRFNSAIFIKFEKDTNFDFKTIALEFLLINGIKVEESVLDFMLLYVERDIASLTIFIQELKKFIEVNKMQVKKTHLKQIFESYEKARNQRNI
jgi:hypothetical protein